MATEIIVVGGLLDAPNQSDFLARLKAEVSDEVSWDWIVCAADRHFEAPRGPMNRVAEKLNLWQRDRRKNAENIVPEELHVVTLFDINGRTKGIVYRYWPEPLLAPLTARTSTELIEWLRSPEANLFPSPEWMAGVTEAAIVAILCKLLRNKSWNSSVQGHAWTKEQNLLTQSPVKRDDRPKAAIEASRLLPTLADRLLLTKGAGQGNTPKEWSIDTRFLAAVKRAMISKSLASLREFECLRGLLDRIAEDQEKPYRLDVEIVTDKVRSVCRERD
ncbi:MAG: hypothetical protein WCJ35_20075 [Planctomycetota bacterium]